MMMMERLLSNATRRLALTSLRPTLLSCSSQTLQLSCQPFQQQQLLRLSSFTSVAAAPPSAPVSDAQTSSNSSSTPSVSAPSSSPSSGVWVSNPPGPIRRRIIVPKIPKTTSFLIVLQEWWGIVPQLERHAEKFAFEGYNVVIPDIYRGRVGVTVAEAAHLMEHMNFQQAIADIGFIVNEIREKNPNAKVATVGFCLGGALSLASAATLKDSQALNGAVSFYGIPDMTAFNLNSISIPVQCHFAELDSQAGFSDPATVDKLEALWKGSGKKNYEMHRLAGVDHAFMNDLQPWADEKRKELFFVGGYSKRVADATWKRTFDFLKKNIF